MGLLTRARATYGLSLILCAVLLGAMAMPAMATNTGRADRGSHADDNAKARGHGKDKNAKKSQQPGASSASQSSTGEPSGKASSERSKSPEAARASKEAGEDSGGTSKKGSSPGSSASKGGAEAGAQSREGTPGTAQKQERDEAKATEENSPAGNKGSMKVRPVGTAAHPPRNYAHLPCTVQVDFYGSPHSGATLTAVSHAPTAPTGQTLLTQTMSFSQSSPNPRGNELVGSTTLDFTSAVSGLTSHAQHGYHVKLTAVQDGPQGGDVKHKVFWVDCPAPGSSADESVAEVEESTQTLDVAKSEVMGFTVERASGDDAVAGRTGSADDTQVAGATVQRDGAVAAVGGRVLAEPAAVGGWRSGVLAATGVGAVTLALLGLVGLGGGAGMLRRLRRR